MGGSVNDPHLANEWRYPGAQSTQPLASPNNQQDALSSTENLQGDFFGEGGLGSALRQALGNDPIPGFNPDGMLGGSGSTGGNAPFIPVPPSNDPFIATPYSHSAISSGGSSDGSFTNSGMGGASNSNNFLSEWASTLDLGGAYNPSFFTTSPDMGSSSYFSQNKMFDFGNTALGSNIPGIGDFAKANSLANKFGYGNENVNNAMNVLGLTGNKVFDYAADATGNKYLGMLNDDWSQRGIMNKALQFGNVPHAGSLMALSDYSMGKNNYGALGQGLAALAGATPLGMLGGYLAGNYLGAEFGSQWNENLTGPAREFTNDYGLQPGTADYDMAVNMFNHTSNDPNATQAQKDLVQQYQDNYTKSVALADMEAMEAEYRANQSYGQEGDATWSPGGGVEYHSSNYNWNADTNTGSDSFGNDISSGTDFSPAPSEPSVETGLGTSEWDTSHSDFSWGDSSDAGDGTTDASDDPGGDDDDAGGWSFSDDDSDSGGGDSGGGGGGGSYIATAATQALGTEGLKLFEDWRDYMFTKLPTFTTSYGRYRVTAPKIVAEIDKKENSKELYKEIWDMHLKPIFDMITEDKDSTKALKDYKIMVRELQNKFLSKEKDNGLF